MPAAASPHQNCSFLHLCTVRAFGSLGSQLRCFLRGERPSWTLSIQQSARSSLCVSTAVLKIFSFYRTFYSRLSDLPVKEWKGVCSTVRGTPYSLLNPHHQEQAPECPKWSEQAMKSLKKTEKESTPLAILLWAYFSVLNIALKNLKVCDTKSINCQRGAR